MSDETVNKIVAKLYDTEPDPRPSKRTFAIEPTEWDDTHTLSSLIIGMQGNNMETEISMTDDDMRNLVFCILGHLPEKYRAEIESWVKS